MSTSYAPPATDLTVRVAEEIRAWMGRRGVNQAQLSRALGETQMWVSDRIRVVPKIVLDLKDLERIAEKLDVRVIDLLPFDLRSAMEDRSHYRVRSTTGRLSTRPQDNRPNGRPTTDSVGPTGGRPRILRDVGAA